MDGEDKTAKLRKQRLRMRREAEGMAQIFGWVPVARRAYAREVLQAVAKGANSLPPDPELAAALRAAHEALAKAQAEIATREETLNVLQAAKTAVEAERDAARVAEEAERKKAETAAAEAQAAAREAEAAREQFVECSDGQRRRKRPSGRPGACRASRVAWCAGWLAVCWNSRG